MNKEEKLNKILTGKTISGITILHGHGEVLKIAFKGIPEKLSIFSWKGCVYKKKDMGDEDVCLTLGDKVIEDDGVRVTSIYDEEDKRTEGHELKSV